MTHINLLPWREKAHAQRQRRFIARLLAGLMISLLAIGYWYWHQQMMISQQTQRNDYLIREIERLSPAMHEIDALEEKRQSLMRRMQVINNLQARRAQSVRLFDELVNVLPEGVQLTGLTQSDAAINLTGRAESNTRVSTLMRNIESSAWLAQPELRVIEQKKRLDNQPDTGIRHFSLNMQQILPPEPLNAPAQ